MNRRNVFLWVLYDFANSVAIVTFFLYFSQWFVIDRGVADLWFNLTFVFATVLLVVTTPVFASVSDKIGRKKMFLNIVTVLTMLSSLGITFVALFRPTWVVLAAIFFFLANYFYQFSFTFYNAMLYDIASQSRRGFISGLGQSANWLGQIAGVLISLPFARGWVLIGEPGRAQTFLPATVIFIVLALPMMLFYRDKQQPGQVSRTNYTGLSSEYKGFFKKIFQLAAYPGVGLFLLGFFFFSDAIITLQNNFPIYLEKVFAISDTEKSLPFLIVLVTSAIGAFISGWAADRIGLKKSVRIIVGIWIFLIPLLALTTNLMLFIVFTGFMGFFYGSIWTVTRAYMTLILPPQEQTHGFSFYTLAERLATFIGPLSWGLVTAVLSDFGSDKYRIAALVLGIFVAVGYYFVRNIPDIKEEVANNIR